MAMMRWTDDSIHTNLFFVLISISFIGTLLRLQKWPK